MYRRTIDEANRLLPWSNSYLAHVAIANAQVLSRCHG
jgi:hypothetical protein